MGKKAGKKEGARDDNAINELLDRMAIANAVLTNNEVAMASILNDCLPIKGIFSVDSVQIEKSVGEKFTGGSSTPVYRIDAQITRQRQLQPKRRRFVIKLVLMPGNDSYILRRRESYAVERRFYDTVANRVRDAHLHVPKLLASDLDGSKPWPAFCILMNDISQQYPQHPDFLTKNQAACALQWIATFHATF
jgi:hypothetical protein